MTDMNSIVGEKSVLFLTLDSLRYDIAIKCFQEGTTQNLRTIMPDVWEKRHTPGTFTYAAHQAFFSGFLPTPAHPGKHERLLAAKFEGSETTTDHTYVFDTPDIISGFGALGYKTVCIGGVGFFNKRTPLGNVLPSLFAESFWQREFGVTEMNSAKNQFQFAAEWVKALSPDDKFFMFINVSAIHQPNYFYKTGAKHDSLETHECALQYVDMQLPILLSEIRRRGDTFCIFCSDHGTAYGEDGYHGHRISHPTVLTVPYTHFLLSQRG